MKKFNTIKNHRKKIYAAMFTAFSLCGHNAANAASVTCNTTLYYCVVNQNDDVTVTTTAAMSISPLEGFGVYMNLAQYKLNDVTISTTGSQADAIRTNSEATYFYANRLTIRATGSSADGINVSSNFNNNYDSVVYVRDYANIGATSGIAVRANNFQNAGSNSVIILPNGSVISVTGTGTASNASAGDGYAVYAGNRDKDTNGLGGLAILQGQNNNTLGNSYVFIGNDSTISTSTRNGYAVYANKGGLVQLGDGVNISTTGTGAYAIYAATEQQGTYTDNVRPGYVFLEGGATLRAANSDIVIRANGVGSIIANKEMTVPTIPDNFERWNRVEGLDKTVTTATSGVFDVVGIMDAINGGEISLNMTDGSIFVGSTNAHLEGATASAINLNIDGVASKWNINANSTLTALNLSSGATLEPYRVANELTSYALQGAVASNGGIINLTNGVAGDTLTIDGDYTASGNARLLIDTVLGDSSSVSDVLVINNGTVSGSTQVGVTNAGGLGALTTGDGILIVKTSNATITGANFWAPTNSIQAGLYAYNVVRGTLSPDNWYLTSNVPPVDPPAPSPVDPPGPSPVNPPAPTDPAGPSLPNIRDAVPVYMSAPALASKLGLAMLGTYHDRVGEDYSDILLLPQQPKEEWCGSGRSKYRCPVTVRAYEKTFLAGWARLFGETGSTSYGGKGSPWKRFDKFSKHGPSYDYDLAGFQAGMDLYRKEHANGIRDIAGVYVGYGNIDADVQAVYGGKAGTMSMDAYSLGGYWTRKGPSGWYIDAVAQGTIFDNVKGTTGSYQMKTRGWAFTASLESGYPFALGSGWTIEPQAQLIYQHLSLDDSHDRAGRVIYGDTDTFYARIGTRVTKEWTLANGRKLTTWARANLWHTFGDKGKTSFPTVAGGSGTMKTSLGGTWGQIGIGISGQVSANMRVFASGDYNMALDKGRGHGLSGRLGVKYIW